MRASLLTLTICLIAIPAYAKYSGGTGVHNDPYQIATAADLIALGETPDDYGKHFIITTDIDLDPNLPGRQVFSKAVIAAPVMHRLFPFAGVLDGNGHTISNLTIRGEWNLGLFGHLASWAEVRNLGVVDVNITGSGGFVGGLVSVNSGTVTQCYITGEVSGDWNIGGLVGNNDNGSISDCYNTATVNGKDLTGGLAGTNYGDVTQSRSSGTVSGASGVGGLVGKNSGIVTHSRSSGTVSGTSGVGGLVGENGYIRITACCSTGAVMGDSDVGGLAGRNAGRISDCYSAGAVDGTDHGIGGLIGSNEGSVASCYNTGAVNGRDCVGGLVGENSFGDIAASYSTGAVTGSGQHVGGLVGDSTIAATMTDSFWDIQTSNQAISAGGTGKTTPEMQDPDTYRAAGWDLLGQTDGPHDIWAEPEGGGYPILYWQLPLGFGLPAFSAGIGEPNDPYTISTAEQLNSIGHNPRLMECHFKVVADLDLTGTHFYTIGDNEFPYSSTFDGNDHTISHLTFESGEYLGMFGELAPTAKAKYLGVVDVNITGLGKYIGALAGRNNGQVIQCYSTGIVTRWSSYVGGLIGFNLGDVTQCYSTGAVNGQNYIGGLVGFNSGNVTQCFSTGEVSGGYYIGGLVGYNSQDTTNCYSTAIVNGGYYVGGLVGENDGQTGMCYCTGTVKGIWLVGGLAGKSSYEDNVYWCMWDTQTSGVTDSAGGTGKTTTELQTVSTFLDAGWDFVDETANGTEDIWWILEGQDYPRLWWELIPEN